MNNSATIPYVTPVRHSSWNRPLVIALLWNVLAPLVPVGLVAMQAANVVPQHTFCCNHPTSAIALFLAPSASGTLAALWAFVRYGSSAGMRNVIIFVAALLIGVGGTILAWGLAMAIRM